MSRCRNKVKYFLPIGLMGKEVEGWCGSIGSNGEILMCCSCQIEAKKKYPQGWRHVPGDICPHGNYVGPELGPDYICGECEG